MDTSNDFPVRVGHMLLTMVEPHRGHAKAYNRWYERDHFYAGCLINPWLFSGGRFVATRPLKDLRFPEDSPIARPDVRQGSYVALYWILEDHFPEWREWSNGQAHKLYRDGRGFAERTHIHTLLYDFDHVHYRDTDPVPLALALDHGFEGFVTATVERCEGVAQSYLDQWHAARWPSWVAGTSIANGSVWSPRTQGNAPMDIPQVENLDRLDMHLFFLDGNAADAWPAFRDWADEIEVSGLGRVSFASPWLPTRVGTDLHSDQLW